MLIEIPSLSDRQKGPTAVCADLQLCRGEGVGGLAEEDLPDERGFTKLFPSLRVYE